MRTSWFSQKSLLRVMAVAGTGALLIALHPVAVDAWSVRPAEVASRIAALRGELPIAQPDGSLLRDLMLHETRLILDLVVDDRLDLAAVRESGRDAKCAAWRGALRSRELMAVEFRYRQTGATSSLFLDRTICG